MGKGDGWIPDASPEVYRGRPASGKSASHDEPAKRDGFLVLRRIKEKHGVALRHVGNTDQKQRATVVIDCERLPESCGQWVTHRFTMYRVEKTPLGEDYGARPMYQCMQCGHSRSFGLLNPEQCMSDRQLKNRAKKADLSTERVRRWREKQRKKALSTEGTPVTPELVCLSQDDVGEKE